MTSVTRSSIGSKKILRSAYFTGYQWLGDFHYNCNQKSFQRWYSDRHTKLLSRKRVSTYIHWQLLVQANSAIGIGSIILKWWIWSYGALVRTLAFNQCGRVCGSCSPCSESFSPDSPPPPPLSPPSLFPTKSALKNSNSTRIEGAHTKTGWGLCGFLCAFYFYLIQFKPMHRLIFDGVYHWNDLRLGFSSLFSCIK